MKHNWNPLSWKNKKALHQPIYEDLSKLNKVIENEKTSSVGFCRRSEGA